LGGVANIALEYATKRYRSNLINWGMLPFILDDAESYGIKPLDKVKIIGIRDALEKGITEIPAELIRQDSTVEKITLKLPNISKEEREIILAGCLINHYSK